MPWLAPARPRSSRAALPGGMFVLLLQNLEWSGWEKADGHLIVVVWYLFKGIQVQVTPRQFSRGKQSVRSEALCLRRRGFKDIHLGFPFEFVITLIQNNFTRLCHKYNISFLLFFLPNKFLLVFLSAGTLINALSDPEIHVWSCLENHSANPAQNPALKIRLTFRSSS